MLKLQVAELQASLSSADCALIGARDDLERDEEIFTGQMQELEALRQAALLSQNHQQQTELRHAHQVRLT